MFKVCIISCGMIANSAHIPAYRMFPDDYTIVAVSDINAQAAENTAKKFGIPRFYTDAQEMLERERPDVVSVCVPNCFHKQYTAMALEMGANVLCEKPLAFTYADAKELFDLANRNGKNLMACQSMRFTPDRLAAKRYIEENGLNDFYYGELSRIRRRGIPYWGTFHIKKISGGGAFADIGVHMLDALVWLMGNPAIRSVRAVTGQNHKDELGTLTGSGALTGEVALARKFDPLEMDVEDFSCGELFFENGATVAVKVAWAANMPECSDIRLIGKKAGIFLPERTVICGAHGEETIPEVTVPYQSAFPGHIYLIDNLKNVLRGKAEPIIRPQETLNVSRILELFYQSAESGTEAFVK